MRIATIVIVGTLLIASVTWATDGRSACELLPLALVSEVAGSSVHIDAKRSSGQERRGDVRGGRHR